MRSRMAKSMLPYDERLCYLSGTNYSNVCELSSCSSSDGRGVFTSSSFLVIFGASYVHLLDE